MWMLRTVAFCLLTLAGMNVSAEPLYDEIYAAYPKKNHIVGIGEVGKSGNYLSDKRVAEVLARTDIARQIKVRMKEETVDIACEGTAGKIFGDSLECKNEFLMVIEQTVDEVLIGSRIVKRGERDGIVYAVAVLSKGAVVEELGRNAEDSIKRTKENLDKAKKGDMDSLKKAEKEYLKAVTYDKEKELIEGVRGRSAKLFEDLEKEIAALKE